MRVLCMLVFLCVATAAMAVQTTITGVFQYQKSERFCIGLLENSLLDEMDCQLDTASTQEGKFRLEIDLSEETIFVFKSTHGKFKFYLKPGDSLHLTILNIWNIKYSGTSAIENNWMFQHQLHQIDFSYPAVVEFWSDQKQKAQMAFDENYEALQALKQQVSPFFFQYVYSELLGLKYQTWNKILSNFDKLGGDVTMTSYMVDEVKKFLKEPIVDNSGSKNYLLCLLNAEKYIPIYKGAECYNIDTIWQKLPNDSTRQVLQYYAKYPKLYKVVEYLAINGTIQNASDTLALQRAQHNMQYLAAKYPRFIGNQTLQKLHYDRSREVMVTALIDFRVLNSRGDTLHIKDLVKDKTLLAFTNIRLNIENDSMTARLRRMSKDTTYRDDYKTLSLFFSDKYEDWQKHVASLPYAADCYFVRKEDLPQIKIDYYLDTVPYYVLVDKDHKIVRKNSFRYELIPGGVRVLRR